MGLFDKAKDTAQNLGDRNNDGRVSKEDLEALKDGSNDEHIKKLQEKADMNDDGKVDMNDLGDLKHKFTR